MNSLPTFFSLLKNLWNINRQIVYGIWRISALKGPLVTIFGGARMAPTNIYTQKAHELAHALVESDISVLTGGGPGIMQAASCGASIDKQKDLGSRTLGITVKSLFETEPRSFCTKNYIVLDYFFARKWLMTHYSVAFAVFPGGFGTLDELTEIMTLMQIKNLHGVPIVLIGKEYWQPFVDWLSNYTLKNGFIAAQDLALLQVTDDLDEALDILKDRCKQCKKRDS